MEALVKNMKIAESRPDSLKVYRIATNPEMVLKYLEEFDAEQTGHHLHPADNGSGETAFME